MLRFFRVSLASGMKSHSGEVVVSWWKAQFLNQNLAQGRGYSSFGKELAMLV